MGMIITSFAAVYLLLSCRAVETQMIEEPAEIQSEIKTITGDTSFTNQARSRYGKYGSNPLKRIQTPAGLPKSIKNFRVVIPGVLYRGGVSGTRGFNKAELLQLCKKGFSKAIYFYNKRFTKRTVDCTNDWGKANQIQYVHYKTQGKYYAPGKGGIYDMLKDVNRVVAANKGPVYIHCHNGWHATGIGAAIAARQFCSYDKQKSTGYLKVTTDGNFSTIASWGPGKVKKFSLKKEFLWSKSTQKSLCSELLNTESQF